MLIHNFCGFTLVNVCLSSAHRFQSLNIFSNRTLYVPSAPNGSYSDYCIFMNFSIFPTFNKMEVVKVFFNPQSPDIFLNNENNIRVVLINPGKYCY